MSEQADEGEQISDQERQKAKDVVLLVLEAVQNKLQGLVQSLSWPGYFSIASIMTILGIQGTCEEALADACRSTGLLHVMEDNLGNFWVCCSSL